MPGTPIQIRLTGTDVTDKANWTQKNGIIQHTVQDPLYNNLQHTPIQNPIPRLIDYYGTLDGVGSLTNLETAAASTGGGFFVGNGVADTQLQNLNPGDVNMIDLRPLMNDFMVGRSQGGVTFSIIIHGKQDQFTDSPTIPSNSESAYVRAANGGSPYDAEFYKKSSWISFHSKESTNIPTIVDTTSVSLRKNFHHGILKLNSSMIAGISQGIDLVYIKSIGSFNWINAAGLSANAIVTFNEKDSPVNETTSANRDVSPTVLSCLNKTLRFLGVSGDNAVFQNLSPSTLFSGVGTINQQVSALIIWGDPNYASAESLPYIIPSENDAVLTIRCKYAPTHGTDNILALVVSSESKTLFGGIDNLGITTGSYVEISGSVNESNNGIYRVEAVFDGVPGDSNYVRLNAISGDLTGDGVVDGADLAQAVTIGDPNILTTVLGNFGQISNSTFQPYQYLRLSRNIVPEEGSRMTIRNVSNLPILHVKYTQVVNP